MHQCSVVCNNPLYPGSFCDGGEAGSKIAQYVDPNYRGVWVDTTAVALPFKCPTTRLVAIKTRPHRTLYAKIVHGDTGLPLFSDAAWRYAGMVQDIGELRLRARENGTVYLHVGPAAKMGTTVIRISDMTSHEFITVTAYDPTKGPTDAPLSTVAATH